MDVQFRVFGFQVRSLSTKYDLAGSIRGFRGNGPNRAGPGLGSTRAGGQDDGSLHKLSQISCHTKKPSKSVLYHIYIQIYAEPIQIRCFCSAPKILLL